MEATHIRFALDLAEFLPLENPGTPSSYLSGAVYPDSRYVTGIPRTKTHDDGCPQDPFAPGLTDFERGWATHLLYDRDAALAKREALAGFPEDGREDDWAFHTAIKLVEDRESRRLMGERLAHMRSVEFDHCPRGEAEEPMRRYYAALREAYAGDASFEEYRATSIAFGMPPSRTDWMIALARTFEGDVRLRQTICGIYGTVVEKYARKGP